MQNAPVTKHHIPLSKQGKCKYFVFKSVVPQSVRQHYVFKWNCSSCRPCLSLWIYQKWFLVERKTQCIILQDGKTKADRSNKSSWVFPTQWWNESPDGTLLLKSAGWLVNAFSSYHPSKPDCVKVGWTCKATFSDL